MFFIKRERKWQKDFKDFKLAAKIPSKLKDNVKPKVSTVINEDITKHCYDIYHCIKFNGTSYVGKDYKRATRTCNYVAIVKSMHQAIIVSINYFIFIPLLEKVVAVGTELKRKKNWPIVSNWESSQLMKVEERWVILCICFKFPGNKFLCYRFSESLKFYLS